MARREKQDDTRVRAEAEAAQAAEPQEKLTGAGALIKKTREWADKLALEHYRSRVMARDLSGVPVVIHEQAGRVEVGPATKVVSLPVNIGGLRYPAVSNPRLFDKLGATAYPSLTLRWIDSNQSSGGLPDGGEMVVLEVNPYIASRLGMEQSDLQVAWYVFMAQSYYDDRESEIGGSTDQQTAGPTTVDGRTGRVMRVNGLRELGQLSDDQKRRMLVDCTAKDIADLFKASIERRSNFGLTIDPYDLVKAITLLTEGVPLLETRWQLMQERMILSMFLGQNPGLVGSVLSSVVDLGVDSGGGYGLREMVADLYAQRIKSWSQLMMAANKIERIGIRPGGIMHAIATSVFESDNSGQLGPSGVVSLPASVFWELLGVPYMVKRLKHLTSPEFRDQVQAVADAKQQKQTAALDALEARISAEAAAQVQIGTRMRRLRPQIIRKVEAAMGPNVSTQLALRNVLNFFDVELTEELIESLIGAQAMKKPMDVVDLDQKVGDSIAEKAARDFTA